ncbi:protein asteroid homolog 1 [Kryptolebias marmoratus]|uniref:protein asteroid homolog 1 n=1 Tax=Kryptolebias marmoratus TaxID=37003 RepID=UPI0018ACBB1B|nr:protein asteroid homolog 1 [Kryptolebias marmoratus]
MGVQGLASFLENHRRIHREVQFRRSRLVIDGCNLNYLLYFSSGLDENHGEEYAAFERLVESFISALRSCDISPYVVLDGASDVSDKKDETLARRSEERVQKASQAATSSRPMHVLPQLAKLVFRQTLVRLEVPVAQCFAESDQEIAALASEWKCPVLSNDSDFFIFDLPAGFLPISHFCWKEVKRSGSQNFISCRRFYTSSFCIFFGIQRQLLPTFAALAGNDYVKLREIRWTQFVPEDQGKPHRLEGLLRWLQDFQQPQDALEAALGLMGDLSTKTREELLQKLHQGMEGYELCPSSLSRFFLHGVPPELSALKEVGLVPLWMLLPLTQARLTADVLDVLHLHTMTGLSPVVEPEELRSSNQISRRIRQVMYGLLLCNTESLQVREIDRDGLKLRSIPVSPMFTRTSKRFKLSSLNQEDRSDRLQVLLEVLGVTQDSLSLLPPQLKLGGHLLLAAESRTSSGPEPAEGSAAGDQHWNQDRTCLQRADRSCTQKLDINVVYSFNQWQVCLKNSIWLNQLLGFPLPEPDIARLFEGTLVHQLVHNMRTGGKPKTLMKSDRTSKEQYRTMLSILHQVQAQQAGVGSENREKASTRKQEQQEPLKEPPLNLQQLFLLHHHEETDPEAHIDVQTLEELQLEEQLSVRTRFKTKDRSNRCNKVQTDPEEGLQGAGHNLTGVGPPN